MVFKDSAGVHSECHFQGSPSEVDVTVIYSACLTGFS